MKKPILTLITILLTVSVAISQTSSDTTCLPNAQLKKAINLIERGKVAEEELIHTKKLVTVLENKVTVKDSVITKLFAEKDIYSNLVRNYEQELSNDKNIIKNLEKSITLEKRISRKQKLSKWIVGVAGIGLGLLISK
jgi:hypothetical protein